MNPGKEHPTTPRKLNNEPGSAEQNSSKYPTMPCLDFMKIFSQEGMPRLPKKFGNYKQLFDWRKNIYFKGRVQRNNYGVLGGCHEFNEFKHNTTTFPSLMLGEQQLTNQYLMMASPDSENFQDYLKALYHTEAIERLIDVRTLYDMQKSIYSKSKQLSDLCDPRYQGNQYDYCVKKLARTAEQPHQSLNQYELHIYSKHSGKEKRILYYTPKKVCLDFYGIPVDTTIDIFNVLDQGFCAMHCMNGLGRSGVILSANYTYKIIKAYKENHAFKAAYDKMCEKDPNIPKPECSKKFVMHILATFNIFRWGVIQSEQQIESVLEIVRVMQLPQGLRKYCFSGIPDARHAELLLGTCGLGKSLIYSDSKDNNYTLAVRIDPEKLEESTIIKRFSISHADSGLFNLEEINSESPLSKKRQSFTQIIKEAEKFLQGNALIKKGGPISVINSNMAWDLLALEGVITSAERKQKNGDKRTVWQIHCEGLEDYKQAIQYQSPDNPHANNKENHPIIHALLTRLMLAGVTIRFDGRQGDSKSCWSSAGAEGEQPKRKKPNVRYTVSSTAGDIFTIVRPSSERIRGIEKAKIEGDFDGFSFTQSTQGFKSGESPNELFSKRWPAISALPEFCQPNNIQDQPTVAPPSSESDTEQKKVPGSPAADNAKSPSSNMSALFVKREGVKGNEEQDGAQELHPRAAAIDLSPALNSGPCLFPHEEDPEESSEESSEEEDEDFDQGPRYQENPWSDDDDSFFSLSR